MKIFKATVICATVLASPSLAGDWSGAYVGVSTSSETGTFDYLYSGVLDPGDSFAMDGSMFGGFAGYNIQSGNLIYGGEVAYSAGTVAIVGDPTSEYQSLIDMNGRFGYSAGAALVYATAGISLGDWMNGADGPYAATGFNYGTGVDFNVTDQFFVGVKYLVRDMNGSMEADFANSTFESVNESIQVRVGMNF
jgi:outer membrane immunogenic protein